MQCDAAPTWVDAVTKRILLAEIVSVHGIRGEVVLRAHTADPAAVGAYGPLMDESGKRSFRIAAAKATNKGVIARLDGIATRNDAEALRGTKLYVPRDRLPPPDEGDYYHEDLVGLSAVAPDGSAIGTIVAVQNFGAGDLIEIRFAAGGQTEYVPFTDACVPTVDVAGGRAVVVLPELIDDPHAETGEDDAP